MLSCIPNTSGKSRVAGSEMQWQAHRMGKEGKEGGHLFSQVLYSILVSALVSMTKIPEQTI